MKDKIAAAVDKAIGAPAEELLSVDEVAAFYKVPKRTIYAWHSNGTGPRAYRVGKYLRFKRSDCIAFLEAQAAS